MSGLHTAGAVILFSTIGIIIACLIAYSVIMKNRHYRCPYCGFRFKTSSVKSFFAKTNGADKLLVCPNCGKSGFMEFKHDDETDSEAEKELPAPGDSDYNPKSDNSSENEDN